MKYCDVTVIIPTYNAEESIERALHSVFAQSSLPKKIIVVDDASKDKTCELVSSISQNAIVEVQLVELDVNSGPSKARNTGWDLSDTMYIAFLDSDDSWDENKLRIQFDFMQKNYLFDMSCHSYNLYERKNINTVESCDDYSLLTKCNILMRNSIGTRTVMLKRNLNFRFDEKKRRAEDFLLWAEIILSNKKVAYLNCDLATIYKMEFGDSGLSGDLSLMHDGAQDALYKLKKNDYFSQLTYRALSIYFYIKHFRRVLLVWLRE